MTLSINFFHSDGKSNTLKVNNPEYIPNIGECIYNKEKGASTFKVDRKEVYYSEVTDNTHVVIITKEI